MKKIRELRKKKGDTIKELADKIQYDYSNLSKIERGLLTPSIKLLSKIANIYEVKLTYLLDNEGFSSEEQSFMEDLELSSEDLLNKYNFLLDGKQVSQKEAEFIIMMIRKLRETLTDQ
ncbi:helix-turn-helix domain-containing protein [Fictibacillus nanhaiensis]|uniref:helix-turn-helix domain-containing protein n=1 Tax=Fictibacillus nanhaiensis TaxID=742169 RepID=UPI001C96A2AB|nr:helix-turn-helix transcriptional regulator [Fictibacillus nanhaiensis]MBY6037583.1 helix-turn-helix domain-containing protein [Fictibacillus nanhaiensis]